MLPVITVIIVSLLPLAIGASYLHGYLEERKKTISDHKKEIGDIRNKFYFSVRLRYLKTPLIVHTTKQLAYYNKLIVHYKNSTRKVHLMPYNLGESNQSYRVRVADYVTKYCRDEAEYIVHGQEAYARFFESIRGQGLLAYFSSPFNTEASKEYILSQIDFLIKNPRAEHGVYNRKNETVIEF